MTMRILTGLCFVLLFSWNYGQHTPTLGNKGTKCYDMFNRPQVCFIKNKFIHLPIYFLIISKLSNLSLLVSLIMNDHAQFQI